MKSCTLRRALVTALLLLVAVPLVAGPFDGGPTSKDPEAKAIAQARKFLRIGEPARAIEVVKKALAKSPNSARLHHYLGLAYVADRKDDLAEAELATALQLDADYPESHTQLAYLSMRRIKGSLPKAKNLGHMLAAVKQVEQAVEKTPAPLDTALRYYLARLHADTVVFRETNPEAAFVNAMKVLAELQKRSPDETRPYVAMGNLRTRHADFIAAGKKYAELKGDTAKRYDTLLDKATADFRKAVAVNPRYLAVVNRIAVIHSVRNKLDEAVKTFADHIPKLRKPLEVAICYRWMAQYLMRAEKLAEAEQKLRTAIKTEPNELASYLLLANVLIRRDQTPQAGALLKDALKTDGNFLNAYVELGLLELRRQNPAEAQVYFEKALNLPSARAHVVATGGRSLAAAKQNLYALAAIRLGDIHMSKGEFHEAVTVFRRLENRMPGSATPAFHTGEVYRRWQKYKTAKEHYQNALRIAPNFIQARAALAEMEALETRLATTPEERAASLKRAIEEYERALKTRPNNAMMLDRMANLRVSLAHCSKPKDRATLEKALANAQAAAKLAPGVTRFRRRLAFIHHDLGDLKEAVAELGKLIDDAKKFLEKNPDEPAAVFQVADLRSTLHSWKPDKAVLKQALDGFALAVKKQPRFFRAYLSAALLVERQKDYQRSADWYNKLLDAAKGQAEVTDLSPQRSRYVLHAAAELAWVYCEYLGKYKEAMKYAKIASQINPKLPSLMDTIGWIHFKEGRVGDAIIHLRLAFKGAPTNPTVGYHLGTALVKHGSHERALAVLQKALQHVEDRKELKEKIEKLIRTTRTKTPGPR